VTALSASPSQFWAQPESTVQHLTFYVQIDCATIFILLTQISFFLIFLRTVAGLMLLLSHEVLAPTVFGLNQSPKICWLLFLLPVPLFIVSRSPLKSMRQDSAPTFLVLAH
jgi:hypothetical protein